MTCKEVSIVRLQEVKVTCGTKAVDKEFKQRFRLESVAMAILWLIITVSVTSLSRALLIEDAHWDGLSVTFGSFTSLPRTVGEAAGQGWVKISDCDDSGQFRGIRYIKDNDHAVILLFDVNGYIAGVQCGIEKTGLPDGYPPAPLQSAFQDNGDLFTLTAYFTDPSKICTTGRKPEQFNDEGTGNNLYIQNGTDPVSQSLLIPQTESELAGTSWTLGHCFPAMGVHYWYNITESMNCDNFFPAFLLYNGGRLNAFGWAMVIEQSSRRFEHPPHSSLSAFLTPVPTCLENFSQLSTMHIYLTAHPTQDLC